MSSELYIWIPCKPADGSDKVKPLHIFLGEDSTGAARTEWKCPHCGMQNPRRKPLERHMGLVMNIPASCPVLLAQDSKRRQMRKFA